ncbi:TetR/AcrR family transcriptional regulator [Glycomyces mayteni]|uniref:TetR/AcrR family transcriptional regulator n=1 Tax=Glycomyces mayteni TaxID=543887 RepID=A0ABW2D2L9_9ACTN|nr:TetR/AcrR family transcriptional regulator [Glycomyces mayteni]
MTTAAGRPPRADAARNVERLLDAARDVFAEHGPDATLKAVAERAGLGAMTLYRHFPNKEALVRASLRRTITERLAPVVAATAADPDARRGLASLMDATLDLVDSERNLLAAGAGPLTADVTGPVLEPIAALVARAQAAGQVRADVTAADVPRIMGMVMSVLWGTEPGRGGWRRYLALVLDALDPRSADPLPAADPEDRCGPC